MTESEKKPANTKDTEAKDVANTPDAAKKKCRKQNCK